MFDKFLFAVFIASFGSIGVMSPQAIAQEQPECYIVDETGELEDLTDICNVSQRRSPESSTTEGENVVNNNINIVNSESGSVETGVATNDGFIIGTEAAAENSGIDSSYLIDNEPGLDYTAYVRRYTTSPNSFDILTRREEVFQFDRHNRSFTSILRDGTSQLPFLIYRYQI